MTSPAIALQLAEARASHPDVGTDEEAAKEHDQHGKKDHS
jgi:hypothetical protein